MYMYAYNFTYNTGAIDKATVTLLYLNINSATEAAKIAAVERPGSLYDVHCVDLAIIIII